MPRENPLGLPKAKRKEREHTMKNKIEIYPYEIFQKISMICQIADSAERYSEEKEDFAEIKKLAFSIENHLEKINDKMQEACS